MQDRNARIELGAECLAAATNSVQAAEALHYALQGRGSYPLDKLLGPLLSARANRILAGIIGIAYLITAVGETLKVVQDVGGESNA